MFIIIKLRFHNIFLKNIANLTLFKLQKLFYNQLFKTKASGH